MTSDSEILNHYIHGCNDRSLEVIWITIVNNYYFF